MRRRLTRGGYATFTWQDFHTQIALTDKGQAVVAAIDEMQTVLDDYLVGYNTKRPHQGRGMNGRTPIQALVQGLPKTQPKEVTQPPKSVKLKAA